MLGVECERMGIQVWCSRLRWRWTCRNRIRSFGSCILNGFGQASRKDDVELQTSQCLPHNSWNDSPVVRVVGFQRWLCIRRKPPCCYGLLELLLGCYVRLNHLVYPRLPSRQEVVNGRLVFRLYLWSCCCYSSVWFHSTLGSCYSRYCHRHCC
jgi:hypothetical protein